MIRRRTDAAVRSARRPAGWRRPRSCGRGARAGGPAGPARPPCRVPGAARGSPPRSAARRRSSPSRRLRRGASRRPGCRAGPRPDRSGRPGSSVAARPRSGGRAAGSRPGRGRSAERARRALPSLAFPIHTAARRPGFDLEPLPRITQGGVPIRTPTRWERSDTRRPVACLAAAGDAGEGRCQDPVPSWPARPFAVARSPDGGGQGGAFDAVQARRHGLPARGRNGRDGDGRRRRAAAAPRPRAPARRRRPASRRRRPPRGADRRARRRARSTCSTRRTSPRRHGRRPGHHRRLAGGDPVQPVLLHPGHRGERRVGRRGPRSRPSPTTTSTRPTSRTEIPTLDNGGVKVPGDGGDAMTVTWNLRDNLKWSDGQDLTCDDFKYAWEWVLDPDNVGVVTSGFDDVTAWDCPSPTEMVLHFKNVFEGYITMVVAPLPRHYLSEIPIKEQVSRPRLPARTRSRACPTSGAFKFESVTPGAELRLAKNPNYTSLKTGQPAHLDTLVFKWYGDPDAMIAGYRNGEVDIATDLQDSDIPKVQDLGDEVSSIPSLTYEYLRPNWSDIGDVDTAPRASAAAPRTPRSSIAATAARWPTRRCARRSPTPSTRTRSTPGCWAASPRSRTRSSAPAPGSTSTRRRPRSTRQGQADPRGRRLDRHRRRRHPREERPAGQDRAVHDDAPGPPGHARAHRRRGSRTSASTRSSTRSTRRRSSPTTTSRRPTRRASCRTATSTWRSTRRPRRSTRWATTSATTAASSTRSA